MRCARLTLFPEEKQNKQETSERSKKGSRQIKEEGNHVSIREDSRVGMKSEDDQPVIEIVDDQVLI
jgi:hypothetical protein